MPDSESDLDAADPDRTLGPAGPPDREGPSAPGDDGPSRQGRGAHGALSGLARRGARRWQSIPRPLRLGLLALASLGLLIALPLVRELARWPSVTRLRTEMPETTAFIERWKDRQEKQGGAAEPAWRPVPYSRISPWLRKAVVVSEDMEFFDHEGFSVHETREALRRAVDRRTAPRGASTITQQLAKNLWLSPSRNLGRKAREAVLTVELERALEKERILDLYLNVVEFGPGIYGAEAAARRYFGIPASDLSRRQAAMLAAVLPRPSTWNPNSASAAYARRVERILELMERAAFLDRRLGVPGRSVPAATPDAIVEPPATGATDPGGDSVAAPGS